MMYVGTRKQTLGAKGMQRRLVAILAADVVGYSRLMGAREEITLSTLKAIRREVVDLQIAEHHGRIFKTTGDGLLVEFASVVDAVNCGVDIQRTMAKRNRGSRTTSRLASIFSRVEQFLTYVVLALRSADNGAGFPG